MSTCKIELNNNVSEYHPKDTVQGKVLCNLNDAIYLHSLKVGLVGEEKTKFLKIRNREIATDNVRTEESKGFNKFLSLEKFFGLNKILNPGNYDFEFSILLPDNIPSSYKCSKGSVKFFIEATILGMDGNKSRCLEEINVVSLLTIPEFAWFDDLVPCQRPYNQSIEKLFPTFCCGGENAVTADIYLPRRAFLQGASVPLQIEVTNTSDEKIHRIEVVLGQTIQCKGAPEDGYSFDHKTLVATNKPAVNENVALYEFVLEVPKTPVLPNFTQCKLFVQKCWLDVKVILRQDLYLKLTTWVIIGQISNVESDMSNDVDRMLSRSNSRTRDQVGGRSSRSLLLPKGPAPYSSFRQRPTGFAMAQPISSPVRNINMPLPPDSTAPNNPTAYPPTAGPTLSLPDVPGESPPTYEEAVQSDVHSNRTQNPRNRGSRSAVAVRDTAPSAPVATFDPSMIGIASYPPVSSPGRNTPPRVSSSVPYPTESPPLRDIPSSERGVLGPAPYPLSSPVSRRGLSSTTTGVSNTCPYPSTSPPLRDLPSLGQGVASVPPYPPASSTTQTVSSSIGVSKTCPYPSTSPPLRDLPSLGVGVASVTPYPPTSSTSQTFSSSMSVSNTCPYPSASPPLRDLPSLGVGVASVPPYPPTSSPQTFSSSIGVCDTCPYPSTSPPLRDLPSLGVDVASVPPYPPTSSTTQTFSSSMGVSDSAPYPLATSPPASDSLGFSTFSHSSAISRPTMSMPMPHITPYPIEIPPGIPTSFTSMPLPPSHLGQPGYPEMCASSDPLSKWDMVRTAVPSMVATDATLSSELYPPIKPPPRVHSITPVAMPMPSSSFTPPVTRRTNLLDAAPYPTDIPLLASGSIGFGVLENINHSNGPTSDRPTRRNT